MTTILLTGNTGQVGWELQRALAPLGSLVAPGRDGMDHANPDSIRSAIRGAKPDVIVNAAGYTAVDKAESEVSLVTRVNAVAPGIIAEEAKRIGAPLVHYSTDYVFDGTQERPYTEDDTPYPLNTYGRSKLAGERAIQAVGGTYVILRTSWVYSARRSNFVLAILRLAREKQMLPVVNDQLGSPSWARALAESTADLLRNRHLIQDHGGVYHLSATGQTSRCEFAKAIIRIMKEISGAKDGWAEISPITSDRYHPPLPARRPLSPVTDKSKIKRAFGIEMPDWESQLRSFLPELAARGMSSHRRSRR
jgi:dTDP-4-dehydrorhamnose reductase